MSRGFFTFLVVLPLLLPPGVCFCNLGLRLDAAITDVDAYNDDSHCCSSDLGSDHSTDRCPVQRHDDRDPTCPTLKNVNRFWLQKTDQLRLSAFFARSSQLITPSEFRVTEVALAPIRSAPDFPLYLALRTLLI